MQRLQVRDSPGSPGHRLRTDENAFAKGFWKTHIYLSLGQTAYSTEYFPAAPQGGADGGSFNPKWSPGPELPEPLYGVSTAVFNDNIYVFGGLHINSRRNNAYQTV